jgi:hypothetical protein
MNTDEVLKQRNIGKYLMIVNIILTENDHAMCSGFSFVSREEIATWASVEEKEIDDLMAYCRAFDKYIIATEAANKFPRSNGLGDYDNVHFYVAYTGKRFGEAFILEHDFPIREDLYGDIANDHYETYCKKWKNYPVSEKFRSAELFIRIMRNYEKRFIGLVFAAMKAGYDWDVICEMIGYKIERERFDILAKNCMKSE